jgi:signal transduction histidine kinase
MHLAGRNPDAERAPRPDHRQDDGTDALRHDLKIPLTVIRGHAQLMLRVVQRMEGPERARLLAGLAAIDAAVGILVTRIERIGDDRA